MQRHIDTREALPYTEERQHCPRVWPRRLSHATFASRWSAKFSQLIKVRLFIPTKTAAAVALEKLRRGGAIELGDVRFEAPIASTVKREKKSAMAREENQAAVGRGVWVVQSRMAGGFVFELPPLRRCSSGCASEAVPRNGMKRHACWALIK
jgi:hypothetical protein